MKKKFIYIIAILAFILSCTSKPEYKTQRHYFVVPLGFITLDINEYLRLTDNAILYSLGEAYYFSAAELLKSLEKEKIELSQNKLIIDPSHYSLFFEPVLEITKINTFTSGFEYVLLFDSNPILKINERYYLIIELSYRYEEIMVSEEISEILEKVKVGEKIRVFREFINYHNIEEKNILKYLYKYKYELESFRIKKRSK